MTTALSAVLPLAALVVNSVVLSNPIVIGALAAGAVCWGGFVTRPDPGRRRVLQLASPDWPVGAMARGARHAAGPLTRWMRRGDVPHPDRVAAELGAVVDVMNVALTSGLSIIASLQLALGHLDGASALRRRLAGQAAFERLDETLVEFGQACGPRARAFAAAVTGSMRTGIPLAPEMDRLGRELREDRRRRLEGKVRRLPVLLLFPLVLCVLPALGLVAIVPVLVAAFGG
ncbi:MAG: type II secretion system F family protein [Acidimicrobiaceae bacterium]|nr:type II secretion system F family protein [Acidimicrobiaceae bacterium]